MRWSYQVTRHSLAVYSVYPPVSAVMLPKGEDTDSIDKIMSIPLLLYEWVKTNGWKNILLFANKGNVKE